MAYSIRTISIALSLLLAVGLVAGAFVISKPPPSVSAESTEELLKAYAEKDSDADGLPDWQESLYKTDPNNAESVQEGMKDGEAVAEGLVKPQFETEDIAQPTRALTVPGEAPTAGSITEQFSRVFLESIVSQSGGKPLTQADQKALVSFLLKEVATKMQSLLESRYSSSDVRVSADTELMAYIAAVESAMRTYNPSLGEENPLTLMQAYVERGDDSAAPKLRRLSKVYEHRVDAYLRITVPPRFAAEHLRLIRAFDVLARATSAAANLKEDPLPVLGALKLIQPAAQDVFTVVKTLAAAVLVEGEPASGAPGALIVNTSRATN